MKKMLVLAAAAAGVLTALPAAAQFAKPEDAIKYRRAAFTVMGTHFARLGAMANGRIPFDAKAASDNAELVAIASHLPFTAFGNGTDLGETRAKPDIWSENDKFRAAASKMQDGAPLFTRPLCQYPQYPRYTGPANDAAAAADAANYTCTSP